MGVVATALSMPGGGPAGALAVVGGGADADVVPVASVVALSLLQAAIKDVAAAADTPSSARRRIASRRDNRPSTWSVAISSAM